MAPKWLLCVDVLLRTYSLTLT